jgi:cytoskeletal protein CcmA (bactofilin family)
VKHLEIKETGTINGDVKTENLVIEMGGRYNGKLDMKIGLEKQPETETKKESSFEIFKKAEKAS